MKFECAPVILEGIVTTTNDDGTTNISPMGPEVQPDMRRLVLKPFCSSTTYRNLKRVAEGVFHVTDDVELLARAAVGKLEPQPELIDARSVRGRILADACRWYAFRVVELDDSAARARIVADVVDSGQIRDFFGFNRAKHAVVEAAILATRIGLLPAEHIAAELLRLGELVEKTGGPQERRAFDFLEEFVRGASSDQSH